MGFRDATIASACLLALCGCETTNTAPREEGVFMLEADEARIWERSHEATEVIHRTGIVIDDPEANAYLESICKRLYPEVDNHPSEFEILILRDPSVNAFVLPNGVTCINTGLLAAMESEAQLAMVLAHELAHFHLRHGVDGFRHLKSQAAFHTVLGVTTFGYSNLISMIGFPAAISGHSREAEREADHLGWQWYSRAGYDKNEAHLTFVQLKRYTEKNPSKRPAFFASHPKLDDRITEIQSLADNSKQEGGVIGVENIIKPLQKLWVTNALLDIDLDNLDRVQLLVDRFSSYTANRSNPDFYYTQAELERKRGGPGSDERIVDLCRQGFLSEKNHPGLLRSSGQANFRLGNWEIAKEQLRTATTLDPNYSKNPFLINFIEQCEKQLSQ